MRRYITKLVNYLNTVNLRQRLVSTVFEIRYYLYNNKLHSIKRALIVIIHIISRFLARKNYMSGLFSSRQIRAYRTLSAVSRLLQRPMDVLVNVTTNNFTHLKSAVDKFTSSKTLNYLAILSGLVMVLLNFIILVCAIF